MKRIEKVYPGYEFYTDQNNSAVLQNGDNHGHLYVAEVSIDQTDDGGYVHQVGTETKYYTRSEMAQMLGVDDVIWENVHVLATRTYGDETTNLRLSEKAQAVYDNSWPIDIFEKETTDGYLYDVQGVFEGSDMTEAELNQLLEDAAEEDAQ